MLSSSSAPDFPEQTKEQSKRRRCPKGQRLRCFYSFKHKKRRHAPMERAAVWFFIIQSTRVSCLFSASGISKKWFYCIGRKTAALCFLLFVGHTGRFLHKGSDLRRCRRPCNIETATNLIKHAIKRLPFRVTLEILFCIHRKHLTSNRLYSILCSFSTKTKIP